MTKEIIAKDFQIPSWAGKPAAGLHLDVMKDGKLIQKLMIDEKKCYYFGRNKENCDFTIDHASCSRVHAVLLWHKHLSRPFLIDLGSTHGTFIGNIRLEPHKPQQVFPDSQLKFGASTRVYIIREKPQQTKSSLLIQSEDNNDLDYDNQKNNLPESEAELDNLTEFNTAHNRRIAQIVDITESNINNIMPTVKKKRKSVIFNEEEQVINPEDVDPSVGKFRNLLQTTIVLNKKRSTDEKQTSNKSGDVKRFKTGLYDDINDDRNEKLNSSANSFDFASKLGIKLPDLAPNLDIFNETTKINSNTGSYIDIESNKSTSIIVNENEFLPRKKKYAKEAWPGRLSTTITPSSSSSTTTTSATSSLYNLF